MIILEYLKTFEPMELVNAFICFGIALRLMMFRQGTSKHKLSYSFLAYILIVATAAIFIRTVMKHYVNVDIWEVVINGVLLAGVIGSKGNVARLIKVEFK